MKRALFQIPRVYGFLTPINKANPVNKTQTKAIAMIPGPMATNMEAVIAL